MPKNTTTQEEITERKFSEEEKRVLIDTDPDFVFSPKHNYSMAKLMVDYPNGVPDSKIRTFLSMNDQEIEKEYQTGIMKIREYLDVDISTPAPTPEQMNKEVSESNVLAKTRVSDMVESEKKTPTKGGRKGK